MSFRMIPWIVCLSLLSALVAPAQGQRLVPQSREQITFSYAPLVKRTAPAVVNVYAARMIKQRRSPFAGDPFFERFFGTRPFGNRPRQRDARSLGSGVIVDASGLVITNHHVIKDADKVKIALADGREFAAEIKLVDERSDLAVLKIEGDEAFPTIPLGDSDALEVGDLVLALGNPFGVGQTVTSGIISALARSRQGIGDFGFFIQTDASINPGNSGGALVDMEGALVGINTAIFSKSGGSNGIGFAVPSDMVRVILDSVRGGSNALVRPWIGADFQAVTADIAASLGQRRPEGALVAGLADNGPAKQAGLRIGDVVLRIDGNRIEHVEALGYRLSTAGIGRDVEMTVLTRGKRRKLRIGLMQAPEDPPRDQIVLQGRSPFAGAQVANLSPRLAQEIGVRSTLTGVVITALDRRSPAARFGFRPKDIVHSVNGIRIADTRQLESLSRERFRSWRYEIERDGKRYRQVVR